MTESTLAPRSLGDGLTMRRATPADIEALVTFNATTHALASGEPNPRIGARAREWLDGTHPVVRPADWTIVETEQGAIVSALAVFSMRWAYAGVPVDVAQIEFVGTAPAYRGRGLIRRQIEAVHHDCRARGALLQVINGIPWFYRQFGYEPALDMGGGCSGPRSGVPELPAGEAEPYAVRPATPDDLAFIAEMDARARERALLSVVRDGDFWRYELDGRGELNIFRRRWCIIQAPDGTRLGYLAHVPRLRGPTAWLSAYELAPGASWLEVTPTVLRYLLAQLDGAEQVEQIGAWLGVEHPLYRAFPRRLATPHLPDTWYVRVSDSVAWLRRVAPVLHHRLASSVAAGYSGELRLNLFRTGLELRFDQGRLSAVEPWSPPDTGAGDAAFPEHTLVHLLMGHRSFDELRAADADCSVASEQADVLLRILFPRQASQVWAIG